MPPTKQKPQRITISLPLPMVNEVDRVIAKFPHYGNRQQFIESAIREKIDKVRAIEAGIQHVADKHL